MEPELHRPATRPRKAPETIQEHKDEAIRLLSYANNGIFSDYAEQAMRRARRHVETAELMSRLADLNH
jgi:hypothetical protein